MSNDYSNYGSYSDLRDLFNKLRHEVLNEKQAMFMQHPEYVEMLNEQIREALKTIDDANRSDTNQPVDHGLSGLMGLGEKGTDKLTTTRIPPPLPNYDETVTSERIIACADLYYAYQHERIGVFRAIIKLQELFKAGKIRLNSGPGALQLYQFDRQRVLRYTMKERMQAYRRVFGYTDISPARGAKSNQKFHTLFSQFNREVAQFYRDKRVSDVIRHNANAMSYGSVAIVRRIGLDLRNNLKSSSYGHVNVLRIEILQLLEQAFEILGAKDIRNLFGADTAWDVLEEVMQRYLHEQINVSQRSRMANAGYEVLSWLGQPDILVNSSADFELRLTYVQESAEEWLTSAESVGLTRKKENHRYSENRKIIPFKQKTII